MSERRKLYWDSSCFIAYISGSHPNEAARTPICQDVMENASRGNVELWTSVLTIAEVIRRKLPTEKKPLPDWARIVQEKAPDVIPFIQELWDFHVKRTAPTKQLSPHEIDLLQRMFHWKHINKINVDEVIARRAVALSQEFGFKPADAIHAASAILKSCDCIQHFDKDYERLSHMIAVENPARITPQGALPFENPT